jgi:hypothetical protein
MSTITWPSGIVPVDPEWGIKANTQVFVSDLNGSVQTVELPGARITCTLRLPPLERADAAQIEAFIAKLRGQANRAQIPLFGRRAPRGTWAGTPRVNNEAGSPTLSQTGTSLVCDGFSASATIKAGDWFNIGSGGQLVMVTDDATANGSGQVTLSVQPPIRTAPADNTLLISTDPVLPTAILDDPHARWTIKPNGTPNYGHTYFTLAFTEAFA